MHIKAENFWEIFKNLHQVLAFLEPFQNQNQPFFIQLLQPTHFSEYFWCSLKPKIKFQSNLIRSEPEVKNLVFFGNFLPLFPLISNVDALFYHLFFQTCTYFKKLCTGLSDCRWRVAQTFQVIYRGDSQWKLILNPNFRRDPNLLILDPNIKIDINSIY